MNYEINTIPHSEQRYETLGDWVNVLRYTCSPHKEILMISVSKMDNEEYEFLIGLHELCEAYLCRKHGITSKQVDEWDLKCKDEEPGSHQDCPYYNEHLAATAVERLMAGFLEVDWEQYEKHLSEVVQ